MSDSPFLPFPPPSLSLSSSPPLFLLLHPSFLLCPLPSLPPSYHSLSAVNWALGPTGALPFWTQQKAEENKPSSSDRGKLPSAKPSPLTYTHSLKITL